MILEIRGLVKRYNGTLAVDNVDLRVASYTGMLLLMAIGIYLTTLLLGRRRFN
ncbi:hypothetical protein [Alkaliphilus serpentinus]|uniref:hypothetical protein n=1 Tax=Alkaliphilus serpentinus TaxID=1482731 RepID=UPI0018657785|nr:hypothetical protein [Alkaliphilus serpentinus]